MKILEIDKPVHVIINPRSGQGAQKLVLSQLLNLMREKGITAVTHPTRSAGHATELATVLKDEASVIIPWGGDGTVNEVTRGLLGSDTPMLCVQGGTENLLAKEMKMPRRPEHILETLIAGNTVEFDVGLINGQSFLSIVGIGFDAEVVRRVASARTGHITHFSYFWPIWRTFWEFDFPHVSVCADGENVFDGEGLVFVGNIQRYSSGLKICSRASCSDGMLDLVIFKCSGQGRLMLHSIFTVINRHHIQPDVIYKTVKEVTVRTEQPLTCEVDGDVGPVSPLQVTVAPDKVRLVVPTGLSWFSRLVDRLFPYQLNVKHGNLFT